MDTYVCIHICVCVYTHIFTYTHIHTHTYIYTHTHAYTLITELLCCTPETNTTFYINYTSIKNIK